MSDNEEVKTKFKGPGEWRSQARRLETPAGRAGEALKKLEEEKATKKSQKSDES